MPINSRVLSVKAANEIQIRLMHISELSEQEVIRRQSLEELRALGIEPYPAALYDVNAYSTDIKSEFKDEGAIPEV